MGPTFYTAKCTITKIEKVRTYKNKVMVTLVEDGVGIHYTFAIDDKDADGLKIGASYGGRFSPLKDE